ncbi:hypothetical protein P4S68_03635 [Pseudoalteromonas sp. Hal099]
MGGTVLMHSRKPLSMEANSGVFNVESTYADVTKSTSRNLVAYIRGKMTTTPLAYY